MSSGAKAADVEAGRGSGASALYPDMMESPDLRWAFIRKVYAIVAVQLLLTACVASTVIFVRPLNVFLSGTIPGYCIFGGMIVLALLLLCPLSAYRKKHPVNLVLLGLFTLMVAGTVGMGCSFTKGKVLLEAAILTCAMVLSLTLFTFWAVRRGWDFSFMGPFLFGSLIILIVFGMIQIFFPLGKISIMIYGLLGSIIFCGFLVYDTGNMIEHYSYDDYIWAAICLFLDIINLFLSMVNVFSSVND